MKPTRLLLSVLACALAGGRAAAATAALEKRLHRCGTFRHLPSYPFDQVQEAGVGALRDEIYVVGGLSANTSEPYFVSRRDVAAWNLLTKKWRRVASLPMPMVAPNVIGYGGYIYVLGGLTDNGRDPFWNYTTASFMLMPAADSWVRLPPVPDAFARGAAAIGRHKHTFWLAGGLRWQNHTSGARHAVDTVTSFDTYTKTWREHARLPGAREHAAGHFHHNVFYVMGGRDNDQQLQKNNWGLRISKKWEDHLATSRWQTLPDMHQPRAGFAMGRHMHKIIVFGGEGNPDDPSGLFEGTKAYNTRKRRWTTLHHWPVPRHGTTGISYVERIFLVGGSKIAGGLEPTGHFDYFTFYPYTTDIFKTHKHANMSLVERGELEERAHGCLWFDN